MLITSANCWAGAKTKHNAYFDKLVNDRICKNFSNLTVGLCNFLVANHSLIRDGNEQDFRKIQSGYEKILSSIPKEDHEKIDSAIKNIFDYSHFSTKRLRRWCAYRLCSHLNIKTCPYCNLSNEITVFEDDEGGEIRPALDHFFDKATYPLFAISLGNLIPSCHHCNSTCKGAADFFVNSHLHPQNDLECIKILLDTPVISARMDLRSLDKARINLVFNGSNKKAINSIKTFKISKRYNGVVDEIRRIAKNMVEYSTSGSNDPKQLGWVLRNVDSNNYRDRMYGRAILDLSSVYL